MIKIFFLSGLRTASLRPVHTRELAPETRSRNTLPGKYSNQYTRRSLLLKHAPETRSRVSTPTSTHEGACSWNRIVQQIWPWSLLPHMKPVWYEGAKLGSKSFVAQHIFSLKIVGADEGALLRERVAGACCGSKLPRVYRPLRLFGTQAVSSDKLTILVITGIKTSRHPVRSWAGMGSRSQDFLDIRRASGSKSSRGVLDISLGGEVLRDPSYPDPV